MKTINEIINESTEVNEGYDSFYQGLKRKDYLIILFLQFGIIAQVMVKLA